MAKVARLFLSERHQGFVVHAVRGIAALVLVAIFASLAMSSIRSTLRSVGEKELAEADRLRVNAVAALSMLEGIDPAETGGACSPAFRERMRAVAYLPDGLNEFLYVRDGGIACSAAADYRAAPVGLPAPDITAVEPFPQGIWINRGLDGLGLRGLSGTVVARGSFAVVLPPLRVGESLSPWMEAEILTIAPDGRSWFRGGKAEIAEAADVLRSDGPFWSTTPIVTVCKGTIDCAVLRGDLRALADHMPGPFVIGLVLCLVAAEGIARASRRWLQRYWSFAARFRRHLDAESLVCLYQPIVDLRTGEVVGCEVLARWRDLDGTIVTPDRFLPIVEEAGLTRVFTALVVRRAHQDLSAAVPADRRIRVNFNIFPGDLHAEELFAILDVFIDGRVRFDIALEIVENDRIDLTTARVEIEKLRNAGFEVWMDDFGTGYFSVETLVHLQLDGVKLDRCFAMAPEGSVMAQMLPIALDMIAATGRPVIVEGVDSVERLESLRARPTPVRYAQGFLFSRPVTVEAFVQVLKGIVTPVRPPGPQLVETVARDSAAA